MKGWWKKRLSQKSPVDEKRSWRSSILRKVKKMVIYKSLHKRGRSTGKLANKLTIQGPQCSKDTVHWYLRFNLGAYSCKRLILRKISKNLTINGFIFPRRDRSGQSEDLMRIIFTDECPVYLSVPGTLKNDRIWGQKQVKSGTHSKVHVCSKNHGLGHNDSFRCVQTTCVASRPNCESIV